MILAIIWMAVVLLAQWFAPPKISLIIFIVNLFMRDPLPLVDEGIGAFIFYAKIIAPLLLREQRHNKDQDEAYHSGKRIGMREASQIYEEKFKRQAMEFLMDKKNWVNDREEYEKLISDMEEYISTLENQENDNKDVIPFIRMAQDDLRNLKELAG